MALPDEQQIHRINLLDQDENSIIDINNMAGVVTNADSQDIPKDNFAELKNLRPYHGRLIETKAWGTKYSTASDVTFVNLFTYINSNFGNNGLTDWVYVGVYINNTTKVTHIYGYDRGVGAWVPIEYLTDVATAGMVSGTDIQLSDGGVSDDTILQVDEQFVVQDFTAGDYVSVTGFGATDDGVYGPVKTVAAGILTFAPATLVGNNNPGEKVSVRRYGFYHDNAKNPIFIHNHNLRILPGSVGYATGTTEAKGVWMGYIDRDYFDGAWSPTGAFYVRPTNIDPPDFTSTLADAWVIPKTASSGFAITNLYLYRFTYVYDGNQESLFSDTIIRFEPTAVTEIAYFQIDAENFNQATFNKRITAINVYRKTVVKLTNATDSEYKLLMSVDLGRKSTKVASAVDGLYEGRYACYIPDATSITFDSAKAYKITLDDGGGTEQALNIVNPQAATTGSGYDVFVFDGSERTPEDDWSSTMAWTIATQAPDESTAGTGVYSGDQTYIVNTALDNNEYFGGIVAKTPAGEGAGYKRSVDKNIGKALHYDTANNQAIADDPWKAVKPGDGLYWFEDGGTTHDLCIFDNSIYGDGTPEHPLTYDNITEDYDLPMPTSIKVNGRFAKMMGGRLFQAYIVLDPGGANEEHDDWVSYSEIGQPDVTPVSNVIRIDDREGGPITGIGEMFGNPVILKEQSLITLNIKDNPTKPALWNKIESIHNIGNVARDGYINVMGELFVVSADGVYRFKPNNLAESDRTPTETLRITEAVQDMFDDAGGDHSGTLSSYDQDTSEIVFYFGLIDTVDQLWRYNINTGDWRQEVSGNTPTIFAMDEDADILMYEADKKVYTSASDESSTTISLKTKMFHTGYKRSNIVREVSVRYKSDAAMTMEIYSNNEMGDGALLHLGSTYVVTDDSGSADFTNITDGAGDAVGLAFTCTGSITPTAWGTGKLRETSALYIGDGSANTVTLPVHPILANHKVTIKRYVTEFYLKIYTS